MRSGLLTVALIACVLAGLTVAFRAHQQGNFHRLKLKANIDTERQDAPVARPGGQEPIMLLRSQMAGDTAPQFLSATLLPGRGMNVLQITAFIPGRGEMNLLASPSIEGAEKAMTGKGPDADGEAGLTMGGAFEVPFADQLGTQWVTGADAARQGLPMPPMAAKPGAEMKGGLMLLSAAETADSETLPDGGTAHAVFHEDDFGGRWMSKTDVTINVLLSSRTIELTVIAANVGDVAEPIGIGWNPRFAVIEDDRSGVKVHVPADNRIEVRDSTRRQPTGRVVPVAGDAKGLTNGGPVSLGSAGTDEYYTGLQQKLLDDGPAAEVINSAGGYGLRLTAMSPKIRTLHLIAPSGGNVITIDPQYNFPDPFGKEWSVDTNSGMVMLEPGQSTEWKVRLEVYALGVSRP